MTNGELVLKRLLEVIEIDTCGIMPSEIEDIIDKAIKDNEDRGKEELKTAVVKIRKNLKKARQKRQNA